MATILERAFLLTFIPVSNGFVATLFSILALLSVGRYIASFACLWPSGLVGIVRCETLKAIAFGNVTLAFATCAGALLFVDPRSFTSAAVTWIRLHSQPPANRVYLARTMEEATKDQNENEQRRVKRHGSGAGLNEKVWCQGLMWLGTPSSGRHRGIKRNRTNKLQKMRGHRNQNDFVCVAV